MENIRFGRQIYRYMINIVDEKKAKRIDSISVGRCFCFLLQETIQHDRILSPQCFKCRIRCLLKESFVERNDQKYLFFININNYNDDDDNVIIKKMLLSDNL